MFIEERYAAFSILYNSLYQGVSVYLRAFFELAVVAYYDKFQDEKLVEFGLWLDYFVGSYRIQQKSIVAQTILKILREKPENLLDVISMAYRPEEIFLFLQAHPHVQRYHYESNDKLGGVNGVRNRYRANNVRYYGKTEEAHLKIKKQWIHERLHQSIN